MKAIFGASMLLMLCCGGGGQEQAQPVAPKSEPQQIAKSVLMVIAPKDFRDEEFKEPHDLFKESGVQVTVASTDTVPAEGMLGMVVTPDITLEQVYSDSFDALVVVGGSGCRMLWDNATLHEIINNFNVTGKTIAAICIAPVVLARAGILKDKKVTVYPTAKDEIGKCGAMYTASDVESCDNIITCSGPKAAKDFAEIILKALNK